MRTKEKLFITLVELDINEVGSQYDPDRDELTKQYFFCDSCIDSLTECGYDIKRIGKRHEARYGGVCDSCDNNWCN